MAKFGFIIPVYNTPIELLDECVHSILGQTFEDFAVVLVDDCSKKEIADHCDAIKMLDDRIHVVHHERNMGLPGARNTGINYIDAEWLLFIDADDYIEPNSCEFFNIIVSKYDCDFFQFSGFLNYRNRQISCSFIFDSDSLFLTYSEKEDFQKRYLLDQTKINVSGSFPIQSACTKLISKSFLMRTKLLFIDVRFAEDALFHLYATEKANSFAVIPFRFYHYRCVEESMVNSFRPYADDEQLKVMEEMWKFAKIYNKDADFIKAMYMLSFVSMQMCIWQKFFNKKYRISYRKKRIECSKFFSKEPFKSTLKNVAFSNLKNNQKIKYILMRLKMYKTLVFLREKYNKKTGRTA